MLLGEVKVPDMSQSELRTDQKLQMVYEYMVQLNKQINYVLQNLGEENLSGDFKETLAELKSGREIIQSVVSREQFATYVKQTAKEISQKADASYTDPETGDTIDFWSKILQNARGIQMITTGETAVGQVQTTSVSVTTAGVAIKTGGTFTVDSGNFNVDGNGNLSASGVEINGNILCNNYPVLTTADIYVGTVAPAENIRSTGMIWIRPGAVYTPSTTPPASVVETTHTYTFNRGYRDGLHYYPISGVLTGTAASPVGSSYSYQIRIPVYIGSDISGASLYLDIGSTRFTASGISGSSGTHKTVTINTTIGTWLAGSADIGFTLSASSNGILNDRDGYQIIMTSRAGG